MTSARRDYLSQDSDNMIAEASDGGQNLEFHGEARRCSPTKPNKRCLPPLVMSAAVLPAFAHTDALLHKRKRCVKSL